MGVGVDMDMAVGVGVKTNKGHPPHPFSCRSDKIPVSFYEGDKLLIVLLCISVNIILQENRTHVKILSQFNEKMSLKFDKNLTRLTQSGK